MRTVDTNVVVRYLVGDDVDQARRAGAVIGREPILVPRSVLLETEWVLRGAYGMPPRRMLAALRALGGLPGVTVEDKGMVVKALDWADAGMDFADALHLAAAAGCVGFLTFDGRFARSGARVAGMSVSVP